MVASASAAQNARKPLVTFRVITKGLSARSQALLVGSTVDHFPDESAAWAKERDRPTVGADRHTAPAARRPAIPKRLYFWRVCPARGIGVALMLPYTNTAMMQMHLDEISLHVAEKTHAVILMDQAAWHTTKNLNPPENITLMFLPPKSPELNPVENTWLYLRQNWLSNRVFDTYDDILDAGCDAWKKLRALPKKISSIGSRDWAVTG